MTPSSAWSSTVAPPERRPQRAVECLGARDGDERAQDLPAVETDLDPYEVVSHSQPPP